MVQLKMMDRNGSTAGSVSVGEVFDTPLHHELLRCAVTLRRVNSHQRTAAVKTRFQVSGSRRKLYRQKGTGRARPGDVKSAQRRGGGIVHGPVTGKRAYKMNKKARQMAVRSAVSEKMRQQRVKVVENWVLETHKTKVLAAWLGKMGVSSALLVFVEPNKNLVRSAANLPRIHPLNQRLVDVHGVLSHEWMVISKDALAALEERMGE